ncbi:ABC transporter permease [Corynebacterium pelargi]|uniref:Choline transport system permease protein OpuBB n=1 Tax=Corynebacterium pelargi TaxID=1471400 RepID=A0A410W5X1_9CORY|nr:ABC transporter permease [Corynebacterium pelargi]QAU51343.1 Choline transport system permease protein OpuBB [Corynebacterium pelargi]GGG81600.1 ABC transporter permease [Corynebacterium pelargi]
MTWIDDLFAALTDTTAWPEYAARMIQHLGISFLAVLIAALIAIPAGTAIGHTGRGSLLVGGVSGAARALPTLGLLTIFGLIFGIGLQAPLLALVILAIPSVLAGTYSGIAAVDRNTIDGSKAMGFTEAQLISRIELPLAAPVIVGGLRNAALQVIATATLAAYTADIGLGRLIFHGLKTRDYIEMLTGSVLVIVLAWIIDVFFGRLASMLRRAVKAS